MPELKVAIIDYEMGNLFSVKQACEFVGLIPLITCDKNEILNSDALILPGVGAFGDAMQNLKKLNLITPIKEFINKGKPFMGICLGMQLLFSESEEFGLHKGLGIIDGRVVKFSQKNSKNIKVPQMGWNRIYKTDKTAWDNSPLYNVQPNQFMYFVHSYYVTPSDNKHILSLTNYEGIEYCSGILYKNIFAIQFHPEKSAKDGLKIYYNWGKIISDFTF